MKKVVKWIAIVVTSVIFLLALAIGIAVWFVFTPEKITPIVRTEAAKFLTCESQIGEVELTFFSTFPSFGLKVNRFALINHILEAPSDTLVKVEQFVGIVDLAAYWNRNELVFSELLLRNGTLNAFTDSLGRTNFDVLKADTTVVATESETSFKFINLEHVGLENIRISYSDRSLGLVTDVRDLNAEFSGNMIADTINTRISVNKGTVSVNYNGEQYLRNASVKAQIPVQLILSKQLLKFDNSDLSVNNLSLSLSGTIGNDTIHNQIITDISYQSKQFAIPELLALIPPSYQSYLKGVVADGLVISDGKITGAYSDSLMPWMDVRVRLQDGTLKTDEFPVPLTAINGEFVFYSDLSNDEKSSFRIDRFAAKTPQSDFQTSGTITHLFSDIHCDLKSEGNFTLTEFKSFLPVEPKMEVSGKASGQVLSQFSMSQLDKMQLDRMKFAGSLHLTNFSAIYDTISMQTDDSFVDFELPNLHPSSKKTQFVSAKIKSKNLQVSTLHHTNARLKNASITFETSDVMDSTRIPDVNCSFRMDSLFAQMDTIGIVANQPVGSFYMMPQKGKNLQAELNVDLSGESLKASFGSRKSSMNRLKFKAHLLDDPVRPQMKIEYTGENLEMAMGSDSARMNKIELKADLVNDQNQKDVFQQWQANGFLKVNQGLISTTMLKYPLEIPSIQMDFDPEVFTIRESKLKIDKSDFSLEGKFSNVLSYFRKDSLLRGNFNFVSSNTDLVQLMLLTSGLGDSTQTTEAALGPYMVPKGIDLLLNVDVAKVDYGQSAATDIRGKMRVKDGLLVLDDFKFTTTAAKMQLTTMYRTPRKNHLFMGLELHMLDVEISELLKIIPNVDSIMPMLRSFSGKGEFHMAAETYLDSMYNPKKSTIRGAASIKGQNLVLMDGETFSEIAKTLRFNKKTHNKVDSLSAEFTVFKREIDVYPFLIVMDKYKGVVAGRHNLDMSFDYHISVVDSPLPIKFGIDITGTLDDMKYRPARCRYPEFYRPVARGELKNSQLELRKMIRDALMQKLAVPQNP